MTNYIFTVVSVIVFPTGNYILQFISCCQGRAPRGPTHSVIYLCPVDHLRTLKMRLLCKIKHLLCEVEYVTKNHHHHRHSYNMY